MSARDEKPVSEVPTLLWAALAIALAAQVTLHSLSKPESRRAADLPPAPSTAALRLASFDERPAASRLAMVYVQAFDLGGENELPYQKLDYARLAQWLQLALDLDPRSEYPLFLASRVYAEVPDPVRMRAMLEFVYAAFLRDPDRRWPALAQASLVAKHRLHDLPLALRYAEAIDHDVSAPDVPGWARQMKVFILEDMNELQAAKVLLGGLLASGHIRDPAEAAFLKQRLEELEAKTKGEVGDAPKRRPLD
ncbi:MAG: hypothetical protein JO035_00695 [Betaproteobacteria bacterium]|nr:hypothetical protein [Betaproteobacteria bacterium]